MQIDYDTAVLPVEEMSAAQRLALSGDELLESFFRSLSDTEVKQLPYWWEFWARPKQKSPPGNWTYWLLLAGRGFGKTASIVEFAIDKARDMPGSRGGIVAATAADVRDILVEGESGILARSSPDFMPLYEPSKRRLTWPNGTVATLFAAERPDRLRGPQFHWAVADEIASWRFPEAWDMLQFGLRLGQNPQCAIATTPRPIPLVKDLIENPHCVVVRGTTYENRDNLAQAFFDQIIRRYEGTRLGRQELLAQILDDVPGALWNREILDKTRLLSFPTLLRIVVGVDPAATTGTTGIVVSGIAEVRGLLHGFTIEDATTEAGASPASWGQAVITAYNKWGADAIVAEINNGGRMVEHVLRTVEGGSDANIKLVHASRGKYTRAEPVSALYEQGRAHNVGFFGPMEDELCEWVPGEESPNRLDALVWCYHELFGLGSDESQPHASVEPTVFSADDIFS